MKIQILNNIAKEGLDTLKKNEFSLSEDYLKASGIVLRSHNLTELEISESLLAIARAGAGTINDLINLNSSLNFHFFLKILFLHHL